MVAKFPVFWMHFKAEQSNQFKVLIEQWFSNEAKLTTKISCNGTIAVPDFVFLLYFKIIVDQIWTLA